MNQKKTEFLPKLGRGSFGTVYRAQCQQTGRPIAIKMLNDPSNDLQSVMSIWREYEILHSLQHPNIVKMYGTTTGRNLQTQKSEFGQIFEYVNGDLNKLIYYAILPMDLIKHLSRQILAGMGFCHLNNIIHRDIKPENILITNDAVVKIGDFGLATKVPKDLKQEMCFDVGTLWYTAPELLHGSKHYGTIIDMWSVGCTIAEMLLKQPIFFGESIEDQRKKIAEACLIRTGLKPDGTSFYFTSLSWNLSRACGCPPDLCDFLVRMLSVNPKFRMTATDALQHDWLKPDPNIPESIYILEGVFGSDAVDIGTVAVEDDSINPIAV